MTALFDGGSSRLHFAWYDGSTLTGQVDVSYPSSIDMMGEIVDNLLGGVRPVKAAACSVSLKWREPLFRAINERIPGKLFVAETVYDINVHVHYDKPETYGIDRALAALGAYHEFHEACVVIDAGTAITIDAVTHEGIILGGYIIPGCQCLFEILSLKTDLPLVGNCEPCDSIGNSTETCITYGITLGFSAAVRELVHRTLKMLGSNAHVLLTGGGAENIKKYLNVPFEHRPHLVLLTLAHIADTLPKYS